MKTANILITKGGILKLADFGLARAFSFRLGTLLEELELKLILKTEPNSLLY